jgi:hypothetical protein
MREMSLPNSPKLRVEKLTRWSFFFGEKTRQNTVCFIMEWELPFLDYINVIFPTCAWLVISYKVEPNFILGV